MSRVPKTPVETLKAKRPCAAGGQHILPQATQVSNVEVGEKLTIGSESKVWLVKACNSCRTSAAACIRVLIPVTWPIATEGIAGRLQKAYRLDVEEFLEALRLQSHSQKLGLNTLSRANTGSRGLADPFAQVIL